MFKLRSNETTGLYILRWAARLLSVVSIALILLFVFGADIGLEQITWRDIGILMLFPVGFLSGLILGWMEELKGGALTVVSIGALYAVFSLKGLILPGWWFLILGIPGLLFLIYGLLTSERVRHSIVAR